MTFEHTVNLILGTSPFLILKIFILLGLILYVLFSLVMIRQVQLMSGVLGGLSQNGLKTITIIHAVLVIFLFIVSLIIL